MKRSDALYIVTALLIVLGTGFTALAPITPYKLMRVLLGSSGCALIFLSGRISKKADWIHENERGL